MRGRRSKNCQESWVYAYFWLMKPILHQSLLREACYILWSRRSERNDPLKVTDSDLFLVIYSFYFFMLAMIHFDCTECLCLVSENPLLQGFKISSSLLCIPILLKLLFNPKEIPIKATQSAGGRVKMGLLMK